MSSQTLHQGVSRPHALVLTALGIVYGDIGTSPLYAIREAFHGPHAIALSTDNIYGVLSLITWALLFIISFKYLQFVLRAENKGEGGVLALTALAAMQSDKKIIAKKFFTYLGLFGAALMVGDSMITPAISVLSAVEGLEIVTPNFSSYVIPITFLILILLFYFQKKGTAKIGAYFGPIMVLWFSVLALLGGYSVFSNPEVLFAISPHYAFNFFANSPGIAFTAMSAVFLVVTGGEALYSDMGHLGRKAISLGWFRVALPCLLLNYYGQGALLLRNPDAIENPFYKMAPEWSLVPLVVVAACATIIASQAVISGLFSVASQCVQLDYAPRLKIIHTSETQLGQIYVPAVNWIALVGTLWLVVEFKTSSSLAAAYGISVSITMVITALLTSIVAYHTWKWKLSTIIPLFLLFLCVDIIFLGANLLKIADGGWVPLTIATITFTLITTWKKGRRILYDRLLSKSYPFENLLEDLKKIKPAQVDGTAIFMVGDRNLTPPTLLHNLKHNKVIHKTVVFLTLVTKKEAYVADTDRVTIKKVAEGFFKVTGYYGFKEVPKVMLLLKKCENLEPEFKLNEPTFFLGREILVAGQGVELAFWRKILFAVMARNATSANNYFQLPLDRVIEVGMRIEL